MLNHPDPWDEFLESTCMASAMAGKLLITALPLTLETQAISTTRSLFRHLSRMSLQTGLSSFILLHNNQINSFFVVSIFTNSICDGKCVLSNPLGITIHGTLSKVLLTN